MSDFEFFNEKTFFAEKVLGNPPMKVLVAIAPMKKEQARLAYPYRPLSKHSESYFGGLGLRDDAYLLSTKEATRCKMCQAAIINEYLDENKICPDCNGKTQCMGTNPHAKVKKY